MRPSRASPERQAALVLAVVALAAIAAGTVTPTLTRQGAGGMGAVASGVHKIKHVVIIMQENRSFDNYFGTYPGADGIPMKNGVPTVCNPENKQCVKPYHNRTDVDIGGPHNASDITAWIDGYKMDGFITRLTVPGWEPSIWPAPPGCTDRFNPKCTGGGPPDVMGYHTRADLPSYWTDADTFVLHDHMPVPRSFSAGTTGAVSTITSPHPRSIRMVTVSACRVC